MNDEMIDLDLASAVEMVRKVIAKSPNKNFRRREGDKGNVCSYFYMNNGNANCLLGHVFKEVGITHEEMGMYNQSSFVTTPFETRFPDDTARFLARVQSAQDSGIPWGEIDIDEIAAEVNE